MEMPRSCSSRRRSVFLPVRSVMSAVLPWSMCPAVPRVRGTAASRDGGVESGEPGTGDPSGERRQHGAGQFVQLGVAHGAQVLSLIHISEPTRLGMISYAVFCLKKKK